MEIWKDIKGYEGMYKVSNLGRVMSIRRKVNGPRGYKTIKQKILKIGKNNFGYSTVTLSKHGKSHRKQVHRLVALAFIPNVNNLPQINHIDGNKSNNVVENLEWITNRDNVIHAYNMGLKKTIQIDKNLLIDLYVNKKYAAMNIAKIMNVSVGTIINNLEKNGIAIRGHEGANKKFIITKEFLEKELKTKTVKEIANELGCSYTTVHNNKIKYGLK